MPVHLWPGSSGDSIPGLTVWWFAAKSASPYPGIALPSRIFYSCVDVSCMYTVTQLPPQVMLTEWQVLHTNSMALGHLSRK